LLKLFLSAKPKQKYLVKAVLVSAAESKRTVLGHFCLAEPKQKQKRLFKASFVDKAEAKTYC
jgi:hypothetical protein